MIWANVDRSWSPVCLFCTFTWPDSARLLPVGPHEQLVLRDPVDSEEELLVRVMAAADVGLQGVGDRVSGDMVRRYRVCVEATGHQSEPFL